MTTQIVTRCRVCGRRLTKPESIEIEIGPVCKRRLESVQLLDEFTGEAIRGQESPVLEAECHSTFLWCSKVRPMEAAA